MSNLFCIKFTENEGESFREIARRASSASAAASYTAKHTHYFTRSPLRSVSLFPYCTQLLSLFITKVLNQRT